MEAKVGRTRCLKESRGGSRRIRGSKTPPRGIFWWFFWAGGKECPNSTEKKFQKRAKQGRNREKQGGTGGSGFCKGKVEEKKGLPVKGKRGRTERERSCKAGEKNIPSTKPPAPISQKGVVRKVSP